MPQLKLDEIAAAVDGTLLSGPSDLAFNQFKIDSREVQNGDLFFCIVGPNNNGHQFLWEAIEKGAKAAIISEEPEERFRSKLTMIRVKDTTQALQKLAAYVRRKMRLQVVGITGSIGKTTTKEMAYVALSPSFPTCRSKGNWNNLYGLPLSLLETPDRCNISILEMGMSYAGELKKLTEIADPDVGVLTGIKAVHMEHFHSMEEIAEAKAELFHSLKRNAIAIFNKDDPRAQKIVAQFPGKKFSYGVKIQADLSASSIKNSIKDGCSFTVKCRQETFPVRLSTFGIHNVYNCLAALCICIALRGELSKAAMALEGFRSYERRGVIWALRDGMTLIDDTYNSNPASMEMILQSLKEEKSDGRKVLVFGDMLELGEDSPLLHSSMGVAISDSDIDMLVGVGTLASYTVKAAKSKGLKECHLFCDSEQAAHHIAPLMKEKDLMLVKGSRAMKMETIVEKILQDFREVS